MRKNYAFLLSLSLCFIGSSSQAQTCTATPDCSSLGYIKTSSDCTGMPSVKCPFDTSKVFCVELSVPCEVGSILYRDKSCSKNVESGKIPIGIVFDTNKRLAVTLEKLDNGVDWAPSGKYTEDVIGLSACTGSDAHNSCNPDGKDNTSKIVSQYGDSTNYAAGYCVVYNTLGTQSGDWFLPSMEELKSIYNAKTYINASLKLLGKPDLSADYYWSSTEGLGDFAWKVNIGTGDTYGTSKDSDVFILPVIAF